MKIPIFSASSSSARTFSLIDPNGAVSLAHVQLARQRQRIDSHEEEITALMSLAANNDRTFHEFMDLQEQILKCSSLQAVLHAIEAKARELNLRVYVRLLQRDDENTV